MSRVRLWLLVSASVALATACVIGPKQEDPASGAFTGDDAGVSGDTSPEPALDVGGPPHDNDGAVPGDADLFDDAAHGDASPADACDGDACEAPPDDAGGDAATDAADADAPSDAVSDTLSDTLMDATATDADAEEGG